MEQLLLKLARQLDALDEASLVTLWEKYSAVAARFEPSKRWEESVLVLSLIQAKRWKNQLFNQQWAAQSRPDGQTGVPPRMAFTLENGQQRAPEDGGEDLRPRAKILPFKSHAAESEAEADTPPTPQEQPD